MPAKSPLRMKRVTSDWDGEAVQVDRVAPPAFSIGRATASVAHCGPEHTAVIDISLSTVRPGQLRGLAIWLEMLADFLGDSAK